MRRFALITAAVFLAGSATAAMAAQRGEPSTRGREMMQEEGARGPGAPEYAPGTKMKQHRSVTKGSSKRAPEHQMKRQERSRDRD
jgi:hypothetical protein